MNTEDDPPPLDRKQCLHGAFLCWIRVELGLYRAIGRNDNVIFLKLLGIYNSRKTPRKVARPADLLCGLPQCGGGRGAKGRVFGSPPPIGSPATWERSRCFDRQVWKCAEMRQNLQGGRDVAFSDVAFTRLSFNDTDEGLNCLGRGQPPKW